VVRAEDVPSRAKLWVDLDSGFDDDGREEVDGKAVRGKGDVGWRWWYDSNKYKVGSKGCCCKALRYY